MDKDHKYGLFDEMPIGKMCGEFIEDVIDEDPDHVANMVDAGVLSLSSEAMNYLTLCLESD